MPPRLERVTVKQVGTDWQATISDERGNVFFVHNEEGKKLALDYAARLASLYQLPFDY